jgi:hypothetical protein
MSFIVSSDELKLYEKFGALPSADCTLCQHKHRLSFRNGTHIYKRICDGTGEKIISMYSPDKLYKVFKRDYWYSDNWDTLEHGQDIDFSRPFFAQFKELQFKVPRIALLNVNTENSEYCNMCVWNKNCYIVMGGDYNEDTMYGVLCMRNRNSMDIDYSNDNELCYMLFNSFECYRSQFVFDSKNCNDCAFVSDCIGCNDCILCTNLMKKSHCIRNKQLSKEEYLKAREKLLNGSYAEQQKNLMELMELRKKRIVKAAHMINCERCTGDYNENSKNCVECYFVWDSEDMRNVFCADTTKDCFQSCCVGHKSQWYFNSQSSAGAHNTFCSFTVIESSDVSYGDTIIGSHNIFGCVGLHRKQYCILNKQYSKEEYEKLRSQIIEHMKKTGEWGEFFPKDCGCFGYNESTAYDFFPLTKEEALTQGFTWHEEKEEPMEVEQVIQAEKLPDNIKDIPDDILNWAVLCEETRKPFRILRQELAFYRKQQLPIPHHHPDFRYRKRMELMNPPQLWNRQCARCKKDIKTAYAPDRLETVYCEECYLKEVY